MRLADEMLDARRTNDRERAARLANDALTEELGAARLAFERGVSAATRLILLRSAANLAREARQWDAGLDLIVRALAAGDLQNHRAEIFRILDTFRTYEHLQVSGVRLADRDVQLTVAGPEAAPGFARAEEVTRRVEHVRSLMLRAAMRRQGVPFGSPTARAAKFRDAFTPYLSTARAASYADTVRFGVNEQTELDLDDAAAEPRFSVEDAIEDMMGAAKAYSEGGLLELQRFIPDPEYARNAATLLRHLSPDDERIATVGLTVQRGGAVEAIALPSRRTVPPVPTWMPKEVRGQALPSPTFTVTGRLLEGSAKNPERARATIVSDGGEELRVRYDETSHGDVIRDYWKHRVRAELVRHGAKYAMLRDIQDA